MHLFSHALLLMTDHKLPIVLLSIEAGKFSINLLSFFWAKWAIVSFAEWDGIFSFFHIFSLAETHCF